MGYYLPPPSLWLLRIVLKMWKDLCTQALHLKELQALQSEIGENQSLMEENKKKRQKELAFSAATRLVASQDSLFVQGVLKMWKDLCIEAHHLRELEKIQSKMEEKNNKKAKELAFSAAIRLIASQD